MEIKVKNVLNGQPLDKRQEKHASFQSILEAFVVCLSVCLSVCGRVQVVQYLYNEERVRENEERSN